MLSMGSPNFVLILNRLYKVGLDGEAEAHLIALACNQTFAQHPACIPQSLGSFLRLHIQITLADLQI